MLGTLFIVASPSGGGKTSLIKALIQRVPDLVVSISHTTRAMRPGETEGRDYFFVEEDAFLRMIAEAQFVEHAHVFGQRYGTSIEQIRTRLDAGTDVLLDIDWQGAAQIRARFKNQMSVFILPPSLDVLKQRLQSRGQDDAAVVEARMCAAKDEMQHYSEFDYLIVNDDFEHAVQQLETIVLSNRLKMVRQQNKERKLLSLLL